MKLHIKHIARIGEANIELDGITVITGPNNSGKSTVGKVLWGLFNSFHDLAGRAFQLRKRRLLAIAKEYLQRFSGRNASKAVEVKIDAALSGTATRDDLFSLLDSMNIPGRERPEWREWKPRFSEVIDIDNDELMRKIVQEDFDFIFNGQSISYLNGDYAEASMSIRSKDVGVKLRRAGLPEIQCEISLQHNAFLMENPEQLLDLELDEYANRVRRNQAAFGDLLSHRILDGYSGATGDALDNLLVDRRIEKLDRDMAALMGGVLRYDSGNGLQFICKEFPDSPLRLANLSQGIKAMAMLYAAFRHGAIGEGDLLILDEPEIHLHPLWQLKYAEFLVLLQKAFHLTVLLTSHSPDFVQAVRLYSRKHGVDGTLKGYVSSCLENGLASMTRLPDDDWDGCFDGFSSSFDMLMSLRSELEAEDES